MNPRVARLGLAFVSLIGLLLAQPAAGRTKPTTCPAARYVVTTSGAPFSVVVTGSPVSLEPICSAVAPKRFKGNRKGVTSLKARWASCATLRGKVRLNARIVDGCSRIEGTLRANKSKLRFTAVLEPPATTTTTSLALSTTTAAPSTTSAPPPPRRCRPSWRSS
jgi:hypothetical protein